MAHQPKTSALGGLYEQLKDGALDRRAFMQRATALGAGAALASVLANAGTAIASGNSLNNGFAFVHQDGEGNQVNVLEQRTAGTEGQTRGEGGELRIISWQAPSVLAPHSSNGSPSTYAGSLAVEPLITYLEDGTLGPVLLEAVPTVENGLLAEDLSSATLRLLPDLLWSDGEPFTANDIRFTWEWISNPENTSVSIQTWANIADIEVVDDLTAEVTFQDQMVTWFEPFTGIDNGVIYPSHVFDDDTSNRNDEFLLNPIGTGPFVVESFVPNDEVRFVANENFRYPDKPYFGSVVYRGGGDPLSSGRAVAETGDFDYAWNIQADPAVIEDINETAQYGQMVANYGTTVEAIYVNFSDPNTEVDGQTSEMNTPNPRLSDPAVRQAMNIAVQRDLIARQFYGDEQLATANIISGYEGFESPTTEWTYDLEEAGRILDEAGWEMDGEVRRKDGEELFIRFASTINQVRQQTQAVVQDAFNQLGIVTELVEVDSAVFFDGSAGNTQGFTHFPWDIAMWSSGAPTPVPISFMNKFYAGPDGENVAQESNGWQRENIQRWQDAEYDELYTELLETTDPERATELLIGLNDRVVSEVAAIPLVVRAFYYGIAERLNEENVGLGPNFVAPYWNIANWTESTGISESDG